MASKDWRVVFRQRTGLSGQSLQPQANAPLRPTLTETRLKAKTETRPPHKTWPTARPEANAQHCRPKALADSPGQIRRTANLAHEAS